MECVHQFEEQFFKVNRILRFPSQTGRRSHLSLGEWVHVFPINLVPMGHIWDLPVRPKPSPRLC